LLNTYERLIGRGGGRALFVLALTLIAMIMAVAAASVTYWLIGPESYGWKHHLALSAGISGVVAPLLLYPLALVIRRLSQASEQLRMVAFSDHLTGLPNVYALKEYLDRQTSNEPTYGFALHYVDIEALKEVNNTLGHDAGNALIQAVAHKLSEAAGNSCYVARIGGDEFAIVQSRAQSECEAGNLARKLIKDCSGPFNVNGQVVHAKLKIGIAFWPTHAMSSYELLKGAHLAMYRAVEADTQIKFFEESIAFTVERNQWLERLLTHALRRREMFLMYQPIYDANVPGKINSVEALARLRCPDGEMISPAEFIPVAERTGLILELTEWVLKEACAEAFHWSDDVALAVNVSVAQFLKTDVPALVRQTLRDSGLAAERLILEVTESVLIDDVSVIGPQLHQIQQMGVKLALDDFGAGYCGINYIRIFTVDKLKIDKSLVDEAIKGAHAHKILSGICRIATDCHLVVTAEGVDRLEKLRMLRELNVDEVQGFLLSKPLLPGDLLNLMNIEQGNIFPLERQRLGAG
jgi:diguanylate cyclase (GGDEF)-like protein